MAASERSRSGIDAPARTRSRCITPRSLRFARSATTGTALPEYAQARKAIWTAVNPHTGARRIDEAFPHELRESTNDHEMFIRLINGSTFQCIGSDQYSRTVGSSAAGVVFL